MKRYRYSYQTIVRFDSLVSHHHFLLRCTPRFSSQQRLIEQQLHLLAECSATVAKDAFGNDVRYGSMNEPHDIFVVASSGVVECHNYKIDDPHPHPIFGSQSRMTHADQNMAEFAKGVSSHGTELIQALELSQAIHSYMKYLPKTTSTETTAIEAFEIRSGVCQDFSHLLLSLCRERGIMARYVVGFVIGTGETHAWVEVYSDDAWYGVDPTHNICVEYGYIKVAHGRDASDCSVTRGVHRGASNHTTEVRVRVEEVIG